MFSLKLVFTTEFRASPGRAQLGLTLRLVSAVCGRGHSIGCRIQRQGHFTFTLHEYILEHASLLQSSNVFPHLFKIGAINLFPFFSSCLSKYKYQVAILSPAVILAQMFEHLNVKSMCSACCLIPLFGYTCAPIRVDSSSCPVPSD